MKWVAPYQKDSDNDTLERRLWDAADQLRANSGLNSNQYSQPALGLIFLRFADARIEAKRAVLVKQGGSGRRGSRVDDPIAYHAEGVLFLTTGAQGCRSRQREVPARRSTRETLAAETPSWRTISRPVRRCWRSAMILRRNPSRSA